MSEIGVRGIDLFKIAGESISGWIPSWKMGGQKPTRQPFCSLMEERLLLYLEYHPQVACMGVVISVPPLPRRIKSPRHSLCLLPSTICLRAMLMCTFLMPSASSRTALC